MIIQNVNQTFCRNENFVALVVPRQSSSCTTTYSSTSPPKDLFTCLDPANTRRNEEATEDCRKGVTGNCYGEGIPEWLEDFTENLEITEPLAPAEISHDSDSERPKTVASRKRTVFLLTSRKTKLRGLQANQDYESSLQKANWKFSTSSREVLVI